MRGFTLLEILISMAILGTLAVLGIWGILTLRRSVELQQSTNDLVSVIKETRSTAKNNTITKNVDTDNYIYGYVLEFTPNSIQRFLCAKDINSLVDVWNCITPGEQIIADFLYTQINVVTSGSAQCKKILFENLTGEIRIITATPTASTPFSDGYCEIDLIHKQNSNKKTVFVDSIKNSFGIKP